MSVLGRLFGRRPPTEEEQLKANEESARRRANREGEWVDYNPVTGETRPLTAREARAAERRGMYSADANARKMAEIDAKNKDGYKY